VVEKVERTRATKGVDADKVPSKGDRSEGVKENEIRIAP